MILKLTGLKSLKSKRSRSPVSRELASFTKMSETSLFAELVKDRNRKEVEAKLAAAAKEQKNTNTSDIPMPTSKDSEAVILPSSDAVDSFSDCKLIIQRSGNENSNYPKLESPKFFGDIQKEITQKEFHENNKTTLTVSERKSIEMDIEETCGGSIQLEPYPGDDKIEQANDNEAANNKLIYSPQSKVEGSDGKSDLIKKSGFSVLDNYRKGSLGETLKKTVELTKNPKTSEKKLKKENLKSKHGSLINKLPLPPGMKSTDLESIDSPPSRSPSPLPTEKKKRNLRSIKDLPLPPGKY